MHSTKEERSSRIRFRNATILDNQQNATDTASGITRIVLPNSPIIVSQAACVCVYYVCMYACTDVCTAWPRFEQTPRAIVEIESLLARNLQFRRVDRLVSAVRQLGTWPDARKVAESATATRHSN